MEPILDRDKDYRAMRKLVDRLLKGAWAELKYGADGGDGNTVVRRDDETGIRIELYRVFPDRPMRFAWVPLYHGYFNGRLVASATSKPGSAFARALVSAQRAQNL